MRPTCRETNWSPRRVDLPSSGRRTSSAVSGGSRLPVYSSGRKMRFSASRLIEHNPDVIEGAGWLIDVLRIELAAD